MSTAQDFRRIAMSLGGTMEGPRFDRIAFKGARIYATLTALSPAKLTSMLEMAWRQALPRKRERPSSRTRR